MPLPLPPPLPPPPPLQGQQPLPEHQAHVGKEPAGRALQGAAAGGGTDAGARKRKKIAEMLGVDPEVARAMGFGL